MTDNHVRMNELDICIDTLDEILFRQSKLYGCIDSVKLSDESKTQDHVIRIR